MFLNITSLFIIPLAIGDEEQFHERITLGVFPFLIGEFFWSRAETDAAQLKIVTDLS